MTDERAPLKDRVTAPELPTPWHPDVALWRPATEADIEAVLELQQAQDRLDHPNFLTTREEIEWEFGHSYVDLAQDTLLAVTADGRVVASGLVIFPPIQDTLVRSVLFGGVHPEFRGRGIGRQLLAWQEARALNQLAASDKTLPGWIMADADERAPRAVRLLQRAGFRVSRYFVQLHRIVAEPIPDVEPADGIRIVPYSPDLSAQTHAARNDAFRDHWGSQPSSDEQWHSIVSAEAFREDLSFAALADSDASTGSDAPTVVGFLLSTVNEEDWEAQGFTGAYIELVGVTRDFRGKRIAPALLSHGLAAVRAAGYQQATLDVDVENPSGALGLYTRMGFTPSTREISLVKEF